MGKASCIVGAGYSFIAGLPLAKDLLTSDFLYYTAQHEEHIQAVQDSYSGWREDNLDRRPEEYLSDLYNDLLFLGPNYVPFDWAVELVLMVLASPPKGTAARGYRTPRYIPELISPTYCSTHTAFWKAIVSSVDELSVITTNYDLLIERALRHQPMRRVFGPGFFYGGLPKPQIVAGTGSERYGRPKYIELTGPVPIYKIHGSLNWSRQENGIAMYQDMRAAYRPQIKAAIIPPVAEKKMPDWLKTVWDGAESELSTSSTWIVCGYSLPEYDHAIKDLLKRAGNGVDCIYVLDPFSAELVPKWQEVAPNAKVYALSKLPEGIAELKSRIS